jgi:hypothetical protein
MRTAPRRPTSRVAAVGDGGVDARTISLRDRAWLFDPQKLTNDMNRGAGAKAQGSSSFLKKRTKKLLLCLVRAFVTAAYGMDKSFLFLFFKKEILPSLP